MAKIETIPDFAKKIAKIKTTDRYALVAVSGEPGEGKSCFASQLCAAEAKENGKKFSYEENMTFQRSELKTWVDGDKDGNNQKPEYSALLLDELISMFFKRNWYDADQIDGIELLNKCRDRHHLIIGNIPSFWDLDAAIFSVITFWVHIPKRGVAWVFQKDRNPFATDKWHRKQNEKSFIKHRHPYKCRGFVTEIHFDDWSPREREVYYMIRNTKRVKTDRQRQREERYRDIKEQRDTLIRLAFTQNEQLTNKALHDVIPSLSKEAIRLIRKGQR